VQAVTELVIDASVALAWCFKDEGNEATARLLERVQTDAAAVPSLWHPEVANVLALAERRRRITPAESAELIALLETFEIVVDEETLARAFTRVLDLAREERLTAYDAAYLELAMRLGLPLASKDGDLCDAAERLGVSVLRAA
jgi:predicted nucleic acid-binding protein